MNGLCYEDPYDRDPEPFEVGTVERRGEMQRLSRQLDAIFDDLDFSWRDRRRLALAEADMLWHNQGITYLSPADREGLAALGLGFRALAMDH